MTQRILLTGATGFLGSVTARLLHRCGYALRLLVRTGSRTDHLAGLDAELFEGDLLEPTTLSAALRGIDALVHMAGDTSLDPRHHHCVWRTNVDGTVNLLSAALDAGVRRVVHTSSVAAVGSTQSPTQLLDEGASWRAGKRVSCYVRSKYRAEREALSIAGRGLDLVVVNPSVVAGPGDPRGVGSGLMLATVRGELPVFIRDGGVGVVDVREVALAHLRALERGVAGERYIVSAENRTWHELTGQLCAQAGVAAPRPIPWPIARGLASVNERLVARLRPGLAARLNREAVDDAHRYWFVDNTRSREALGLRYRPLRETLLDTLRWALQSGRLQASTPQLQALAADEPLDMGRELERLLALEEPAASARPAPQVDGAIIAHNGGHA